MLAQLRVALGLETAAFERGSKRAAAEVDQLGTKMEKGAASVGKIGKAAIAAGAALAGSAIVATLKDLVVQGLEYASALGETAQQLGVSTKALQEYRYAATQVGLSQEDMDKSLAKLTRSMGEALNGVKGPAEAFDKLGIDIKAFVTSGRDAGDLLPIIAEKIKGLGSDSERAATLVDLFGRNGQKLMPLLSDGARGVNDLRKAAHDFGIVMSEDMIKKADAASDKISSLETIMKAKLAVTVADNADKIIEMANALEKLIKRLSDTYDATKRLMDGPFGKFARGFADMQMSGGLIPWMMSDSQAQAKPTGGAAAAPASQARWPTGAAPSVLHPTSTMSKPWSNTTRPSLLLKTNLAASRAGYTPGAGITGGIEAIGGTAAQVEQAMERMASANDNAAARADIANVQIVRSFKDMADQTISALDRVAGAVRGGGFLDILSSVIGFGLQLGSIGAFGKKVASNINATPRAHGGPALAGRVHLVGERGPELFVPGGSGNVVPNGALGGVTNNYFSGNLMTPEFWQAIQAGDIAAANAGGTLGVARMRQSSKWALR